MVSAKVSVAQALDVCCVSAKRCWKLPDPGSGPQAASVQFQVDNNLILKTPPFIITFSIRVLP